MRFRCRFGFALGALFGGGFRTLFGGVGRCIRLIFQSQDRSYPLQRLEVGKVCVKCLRFVGIFRIDSCLTGLKLPLDPIYVVRCEVPHESRSRFVMYDVADLNVSRLS